MVSTEFPNGGSWFVANWVFRQLTTDVKERSPDAEIRDCLDEAEAIGLLDFSTMEKSLSSRLMELIRTVAEDTVGGRVEGWRPENEAEHRLYCGAITELIAAIRDEQSANPN
jgi:hypothetical protein